jgi:hypothetical protein
MHHWVSFDRNTPIAPFPLISGQLEMEDEDTIDVFQQQTGGLC